VTSRLGTGISKSFFYSVVTGVLYTPAVKFEEFSYRYIDIVASSAIYLSIFNFTWRCCLYSTLLSILCQVIAKFGTCTAVVGLNGTLVEANTLTFTLECTHFIFNKCPI
jgi:hypothetical protein